MFRRWILATVMALIAITPATVWAKSWVCQHNGKQRVTQHPERFSDCVDPRSGEAYDPATEEPAPTATGASTNSASPPVAPKKEAWREYLEKITAENEEKEAAQREARLAASERRLRRREVRAEEEQARAQREQARQARINNILRARRR